MTSGDVIDIFRSPLKSTHSSAIELIYLRGRFAFHSLFKSVNSRRTFGIFPMGIRFSSIFLFFYLRGCFPENSRCFLRRRMSWRCKYCFFIWENRVLRGRCVRKGVCVGKPYEEKSRLEDGTMQNAIILRIGISGGNEIMIMNVIFMTNHVLWWWLLIKVHY